MPLSRLLSLIALFTLLFTSLSADYRYDVIEDFDLGSVTLNSWADQDLQPSSWLLDNTTTHNASPYALKLSGNTWKVQSINPVATVAATVFQAAIRHTNGGAAQGIGFSDGTHQLYYSVSGNTVLNIEEWIPVYQGAFSQNTWNQYHFPIGTDWQAFFGYLPIITSIIYINDMDSVTPRSVWFDSIFNITSDLPQAPLVSIMHGSPTWKNTRDIAVQFNAIVTDPDSDTFSYFWTFGDGNTSTEENPLHTFTVTDAHQYTVALQVKDSTGRIGLASTQLAVDEGPSSLPLTMNFVGDVMLARRYENYVIPTLGVNGIFTPTLPLLGEAADVTVANLEVVLSNTGTPHPTKSVVYRGNPAYVSALNYAGIDVVSLANNHTMDYGITALQQMQGLLSAQGIAYSGAGTDSYEAYKPVFINRKGLNIAFLRNCDRTGQYNNAQPFLQAG